MTEEEDNKMAGRWQKDAQGILIFVSPHVFFRIAPCDNCKPPDQPVFCRCRGVDHRVGPRPQTKLAGHLRVLSREHLSVSHRPQCIWRIDPPHCRQAACLLPANVRHLGERTLVLEPSRQSYLCSFGDTTASMGTSVHEVHPTGAV
jgi:hypothetical protein